MTDMHELQSGDNACTNPAMTEHNTASAQAAALDGRLLELARGDEWQELADIVARRDALLARVPAGEREQALRAARKCTERLHTLAQAAKLRCAEQLALLKRGRRAAESYRANR